MTPSPHKILWPLQVMIALLLLGFLYVPLFPDLWHVWNEDPNYGHGLFVPLLVCFLLWWKREEIGEIEQKPYGPGLALVVLGLLQYLLGMAGNELFTMRTSMIVVMLGILLTLVGKGGARVLLFPVLYLLLMIPIPYILYYAAAFPMKLFATQCSVAIVELFRVSVHREGNIIFLPSGALEVANACSGLRSLMSLLTFGLIFAYVAQKTCLFRSILVAAILPVAILANIVRIVATVFLAYVKGPESAYGFMHETSGMVVYTVATLLVLGINEILRRAKGYRAGAGKAVLP